MSDLTILGTHNLTFCSKWVADKVEKLGIGEWASEVGKVIEQTAWSGTWDDGICDQE